MTKKILFAILATILSVFIPIVMNAQEPAVGVFPVRDGEVYYEKIIGLDSVNKQEIFKRTKIWAVDAFRSQKNALQTEDKEDGFIIYKTNFTELFTMPSLAAIPNPKPDVWTFYCTIKFLIKDSKCKIIIYDFDFESPNIIYPKKENPILNYRSAMEPELRKWLMSKPNKNKFFENVRTTFLSANNTVNEIITSYEKMIVNKENSEF